MQFAQYFPDFGKVSPLATQLSWSHFLEVLPVKNNDARHFYIQQAAENLWGKRELRNQIERKAFERHEIAGTKLSINKNNELSHTFKDPYFLDFLELKNGYLEKDIEAARSTD